MRIAVGTDRGVMILKPGAAIEDSWRLVSFAHPNRRIQALLAGNGGAVVAASSSGTIHKTKDGENWMTTMEGLQNRNIQSICSHPEDQLTMFIGTQPPAIYKSTTGGLRWQKITSFNSVPSAANWSYPVPPYRASVTKVIQHPLHANVVMASVAQGGFLGSLDSGLTWMERPVSISREINDLALHPERPARIIAATSTGVFRSEDLGSTWQPIQTGLPYSFAWKIAVSPGNPDLIMACLSQRREEESDQLLAFSTNGGNHWEIRNTGLPSLNGHRITCMHALGDSLFIFGTETGSMFLTVDSGRIWRSVFYNQVPVRSILMLPE